MSTTHLPPFPPLDEECFIDANILHAHEIALGPVSTYATSLIREIAAGQRRAAVNSTVLGEAIHKVMFSEAAMVLNRPRAGLLGWVKKHPTEIRKLSLFRQAAQEFASFPWRLLETDMPTILRSVELAQHHGLLTNDALIVALMERNSIGHLVTNDDDFVQVPGITVWKPR